MKIFDTLHLNYKGINKVKILYNSYIAAYHVSHIVVVEMVFIEILIHDDDDYDDYDNYDDDDNKS